MLFVGFHAYSKYKNVKQKSLVYLLFRLLLDIPYIKENDFYPSRSVVSSLTFTGCIEIQKSHSIALFFWITAAQDREVLNLQNAFWEAVHLWDKDLVCYSSIIVENAAVVLIWREHAWICLQSKVVSSNLILGCDFG